MNEYTYTSCPQCHAINKVAVDKSNQGVCGKCKTALKFHQLVSEIDEVGLMKLIANSDLPIIVDFWAPWCGPCRSFAPTFESSSTANKGKMVYSKINTENFPRISEQFNIRGIPSLLIFKNGKEIARESGAFPIDQLNKWVTKFY